MHVHKLHNLKFYYMSPEQLFQICVSSSENFQKIQHFFRDQKQDTKIINTYLHHIIQ
jgi:hypothetical protein